MPYTHTFEMIVNSELTLGGELSFNNHSKPKISFTNTVAMPVEELKRVMRFIDEVILLYSQSGEIQKIEIVKKQ